MNFKPIVPFILGLLFGIGGCSTDPEVDFNKLDDFYFINCSLKMNPSNNENFTQQVYVQKIRYLVDYVFNPDEDQSLGVRGASVSINGPEEVYHFNDIGYGIYEYASEDTINPFRFGESYSLKVIFPDGNIATSKIITPMMYFEPGKDTIWIKPDSITSWYYPEWGGKYPKSVEGLHFTDTIRYEISNGSIMTQPAPHNYEEWISLYNPQIISNLLWYKRDTTANSIVISTASDSLNIFISRFESREIWTNFSIQHQAEINLERMAHDDSWPIENLDEVSNIIGAKGIFTSERLRYERSYILAVKK